MANSLLLLLILLLFMLVATLVTIVVGKVTTTALDISWIGDIALWELCIVLCFFHKGFLWLSMCVIALFSILILNISAGDEIARTQRGNNNAYCQDNDISWYVATWLHALYQPTHVHIGLIGRISKRTSVVRIFSNSVRKWATFVSVMMYVACSSVYLILTNNA